MSDALSQPLQRPNALRPLLGLTVLIVEDSRYASEALRLMCLRSGARIRRADCLASARRHLAAYRPSVSIVDLGLPDGRGEALIAELRTMLPPVPVILGASGDDGAEARALEAGADGFLAKPIASLAAFQQAILSRLNDPERQMLRALPSEAITPDPLALRDDLIHAAEVLHPDAGEAALDYAAQFLRVLARSAGDAPLEQAANRLAARDGSIRGQITRLVETRIRDMAPV